MKVGDTVWKIKGDPYGKKGVIIREIPIVKTNQEKTIKPTNVPLKNYYFEMKANDGSIFLGAEDELELLE